MNSMTVRLGFVPSYRWSYTDWVDQMRRESLAATFRREGVDGLILSPLVFGDERSAVQVAEQMGLPELRAALLQACQFLDIQPVWVD